MQVPVWCGVDFASTSCTTNSVRNSDRTCVAPVVLRKGSWDDRSHANKPFRANVASNLKTLRTKAIGSASKQPSAKASREQYVQPWLYRS